MTDADEDYGALSQRHLASIKHDMRVTLEDAAVRAMHMTWVCLSDEKRGRIARQTGPYVADSFEPHEAEVRSLNPRDDWRGLTKEERRAVVAGMPKPFMMRDMLAAIEAKLKEKNT